MVAGCCFCVSKEIMDVIGKLDDNIFLYYEEDALAQIIYKLNKKCILNPNAKIIHLGTQTITNSPFSCFSRYKSALYVLFRYCGAKKSDLRLIFLIYFLSLLTKSIKNKEYFTKAMELKHFFNKLK